MSVSEPEWPDPPEVDSYLRISPRLADALGVGTRAGAARGHVIADELAEQLGRDPARLGPEAYAVLLDMVATLEDLLREQPASVLDVLEADWHVRIAHAATEHVDLATAVAACEQFGWRRLPRNVRVEALADFLPAARAVLAGELTNRLVKMLARWDKDGVWAPRASLGLVTSRRVEAL